MKALIILGLSLMATTAFAKNLQCHGHYVQDFTLSMKNGKAERILGLDGKNYEVFSSSGKAQLGKSFAVTAQKVNAPFIRGNVEQGIALLLDGSINTDGEYTGTLASNGELNVIFCK